jgi:Tfp pilus assembly protein PilO
MKKQVAISLSIILALGLLGFFFLISPQVEERMTIRASLVAANGNLDDFRKTMLQFPEYFDHEKEIFQTKKLMVSQLYTKENLIKLFDELKTQALQADLNLLEISPSVEELLALNHQLPSDSQVQQLNLIIRLNGNFRNLGKFIKAIEAERFYQGINFCKIAGTSEGETAPEMALGFKALLGALKEI